MRMLLRRSLSGFNHLMLGLKLWDFRIALIDACYAKLSGMLTNLGFLFSRLARSSAMEVPALQHGVRVACKGETSRKQARCHDKSCQ